MSNIKRSLPEDYSTAPVSEPDVPELDEIPEQYMLMHSIDSDIQQLKGYVIAPKDAKQLRKLAESLNILADYSERPF